MAPAPGAAKASTIVREDGSAMVSAAEPPELAFGQVAGPSNREVHSIVATGPPRPERR
jgi:hypothetical protein